MVSYGREAGSVTSIFAQFPAAAYTQSRQTKPGQIGAKVGSTAGPVWSRIRRSKISSRTWLAFFGLNKDLSARISPIALVVQYPLEEGYFEESGPFPSYEELEGETEGQKLRSFADALEPLVGNAIADPLALTCNQCNLVCGPNAEESQNRWKMIQNGGILCFKENNEPYFTHDFDEAVELREKSPYQIKEQVKKESFKLRFGLMVKNFGIDFHAIFKGRKYRKKLARVLEERGLPPQ